MGGREFRVQCDRFPEQAYGYGTVGFVDAIEMRQAAL